MSDIISASPVRARNVSAVLGPTNTGKTHLAIERMLAHESGMIGLPLRLLAREVYDRICAKTEPENVALITGEEKIKPENARYYVCTVEAMPQDVKVDFLAVDEIQLASDLERGHVFTHRLFTARGESETLMLGAATMTGVIRKLLPDANIIARQRLSKLSYAGSKKLSRLPRRSAIIAFSARDVYEIAELIRRQRGGAAVVLGALSPRTRNAQVAMYQSGEVDFLVATDAIGMGLNLDIDHVAFAGIRKFDGQNHRALHPAELAQIAGRAGRHTRDGTFGVTAAVDPFEPELIDRLEQHNFDAITHLQWRNADLSFTSLEALQDSLQRLPEGQPHLVRARQADDVIALENCAADPDVKARLTGPAALETLWDCCQIPDYRKISATSHGELVARIFGWLTADKGTIPEDWMAEQLADSDRTDGDLDTIATRIAHIRTWTFIANRAGWLDHAEDWQAKTRAAEDRLSDALHEALTHRFVDKRTSVLMRRLRDKDELFADISKQGEIHVEDHFVGRLSGFSFTPESHGGDLNSKAARSAAAKVLTGELSQRATRLAQDANEHFTLSHTGTILWQGVPVARLEKSDNPLVPAIHVISDDHLEDPDRQRIIERLTRFYADYAHQHIEPLLALQTTGDIEGLARGIAFQLIENFGSLNRRDIADDIAKLDQPMRAQLRKYGVRFGAYNIFIPALLKPAAARLVTLLWALTRGADHKIDASDMPAPPRAGLTSDKADPDLPPAFYRAAGYHVLGGRAIRIDMLERLGDLIRPLVYWRKSGDQPKRPAAALPGGGFRVIPDMLSITGCSKDEMTAVLKDLGYRLDRRPRKYRPGTSPDERRHALTTHFAALRAIAPFTGLSASDINRLEQKRQRALERKLANEPDSDEIWFVRPARAPHQQRRRKKPFQPAAQRQPHANDNSKDQQRGQNNRNEQDRQGDRNRPRRQRHTATARTGEASTRRENDNRADNRTGNRRQKQRNTRNQRQNQRGNQRTPRQWSSEPRQKRKEADPDSPFAALGLLKEKLSGAGRKPDNKKT